MTVYVNVKDINDNSPEFASSSYSGSVAEDIAPGVSIMDVSATDADSGDNGNLEYSIIGKDIYSGHYPKKQGSNKRKDGPTEKKRKKGKKRGERGENRRIKVRKEGKRS